MAFVVLVAHCICVKGVDKGCCHNNGEMALQPYHQGDGEQPNAAYDCSNQNGALVDRHTALACPGPPQEAGNALVCASYFPVLLTTTYLIQPQRGVEALFLHSLLPFYGPELGQIESILSHKKQGSMQKFRLCRRL